MIRLESELNEHVTFEHEGCAFPARWAGRWFQSGVIAPIAIDGDRLSTKGKCLSSEGDKFLIVDEKGCYRCVVMHEKHTNVLQYKETFCHRRDALPHLCSLITGDALLYSMFREGAAPAPCPLKGPFSFTYNSEREFLWPIPLYRPTFRSITSFPLHNALVTSLGLRVSMGGDDHLLSGGSHTRFLFEI
ncbi:hypothetical protein EVAR_85356_1 [Eumeta japonica]|uniref:DUF7044 domain-containing protein n=1 Tax=Eumeta variegata TaxID=151549 RepID=A0A4C1WSV3_EUMVA|nr:hypothetical protein EVAR_85356_1 [Eumeta japonica]